MHLHILSCHTLCSKQYNLEITDGNQVLLVSHVKRLGPAGAPPPGPAMLIPELCYLTGYCLILSLFTHFNILTFLGIDCFMHCIAIKYVLKGNFTLTDFCDKTLQLWRKVFRLLA